MAGKRFVIIGDGAAGTTAAQYLRAVDAQATIIILSDDPHPAYFRAALTNYLLGALRTEQIFAVPPSFYDELRIHRAQARVVSIDPAKSQVILAQGARVPYDALLIATGSRCRPPIFEGWWHPGIMTMRTLQDVNKVLDLVKQRSLRTAVLVGGGPLALEWAHGLSVRGVAVTIVVRETRFLQSAIDGVASDLLLARLRHGGVDVRMSEEVAAALPGPDGRINAVMLRSGGKLPCDLLAVAIGVVCNSEVVAKSGIKVASNGGIEVDARMRTNVPNIFAAGDVATFEGRLLQLWEPARTQGRIAAINMVGVAAHSASGRGTGRSASDGRYEPGAHYMATRLYDLDCASIGEIGAGNEELVDFPQGTGKISYRKLSLKDGRLVGALMFGEREAHVRRLGRSFKRLIDAKLDVRAIKDDLLDPSFDLPAWLNKHALIDKPHAQADASVAAGSVRNMRVAKSIDVSALGPLAAEVGAKAGWDPSMTAAPTPEQLLALAKAAAADDRAVVPESIRDGGVGGGGMFAAFADVGPPPTVTIDAPRGRVVLGGSTGKSSAIIGRDRVSAIVVEDRLVSSAHAEITISGQAVYVRDLGSSNGTWVSGVVVTTPRRLRAGDKIRVGVTELMVHVELAAGAAHVPSPSAQGWLEGRSSGIPGASPAHAASASGSLMPYLEVRSGRAVGLSFGLSHSPVTIGRDVRSNIHLEDEWIDLHHATIRKGEKDWELADAKSHGVTKKNGFVCPPEVWLPLAVGDIVQVGYVELAYVMKEASDDEMPVVSPKIASAPMTPPVISPQARTSRDDVSRVPHVSEPPRAVRHAMAIPARVSNEPPAMEAVPATVAEPAPAGFASAAASPSTADVAIAQAAIAHAAAPWQSAPANRPRHHAMAMPARASTPSPVRARIVMKTGPMSNTGTELTGEITILGSLGGPANVVIADPRVAPQHAEIARRADGFYVRDLGSPSGTLCRGHVLGSAPLKLAHGDVLVLGGTTQLLFEEDAAR